MGPPSWCRGGNAGPMTGATPPGWKREAQEEQLRSRTLRNGEGIVIGSASFVNGEFDKLGNYTPFFGSSRLPSKPEKNMSSVRGLKR